MGVNRAVPAGRHCCGRPRLQGVAQAKVQLQLLLLLPLTGYLLLGNPALTPVSRRCVQQQMDGTSPNANPP